MEEVLGTCERAYDAQYPEVCMDEQSVPMVNDTCESLPAPRNHPQRVDFEGERPGTAAVFIFFNPLSH